MVLQPDILLQTLRKGYSKNLIKNIAGCNIVSCTKAILDCDSITLIIGDILDASPQVCVNSAWKVSIKPIKTLINFKNLKKSRLGENLKFSVWVDCYVPISTNCWWFSDHLISFGQMRNIRIVNLPLTESFLFLILGHASCVTWDKCYKKQAASFLTGVLSCKLANYKYLFTLIFLGINVLDTASANEVTEVKVVCHFILQIIWRYKLLFIKPQMFIKQSDMQAVSAHV